MTHQHLLVRPWDFAPGTVIRVSHGIYDHLALLGEYAIAGERAVLSFSSCAGGLLEEPLGSFAGGRQVTLDGYPGHLPPALVLRRARAASTQPYSWFRFNCEHFIRLAHGLPVESPQLRQWMTLGGVIGVFALAARA